jgi:hypothetical protein
MTCIYSLSTAARKVVVGQFEFPLRKHSGRAVSERTGSMTRVEARCSISGVAWKAAGRGRVRWPVGGRAIRHSPLIFADFETAISKGCRQNIAASPALNRSRYD